MKSSNCKKNLKLSQTKKNLNLYENDKYNDDIRKVHEDVLSMGLSSRNIEKCVRFVLEKLAKEMILEKKLLRHKKFDVRQMCCSEKTQYRFYKIKKRILALCCQKLELFVKCGTRILWKSQ